MARATAQSWFSLVAGLVAGATVLPAPVRAGDSWQVAQVVGRSSALQALNSGIEAQRRGDYEAAAASFQYALSRQDDLPPQQRQELARLVHDNAQALQARREGAELLRRAEHAVQQGHSADAIDLVKKASASEQYLTGPDKERLQKMDLQLRGQRSMTPAAANAIAAQARTHVLQARKAIAQGNWEAAEALARQAEQSGAGFGPKEDSPRRVLEDLDALRRDPRALIQAARLRLTCHDYDQAERLAHQAEKIKSLWGPLWSDTPAKILREIEEARALTPATGGPRPGANAAQQNAGGTLAQGDLRIPANGTPGGPAPTPAASAADPEKARALLRQGREALARGDLAQARRCAATVRSMQVELLWNEDNPDKLLNDLAARETKRPNAQAAAGPVPRTKEEALKLLDKGRQELAEGKLDEAAQDCLRAKSCPSAHWGLFEDTPDSLLAEVDKARQRKNKDESVLVLADARRLYEKGDYDAAYKKALRAKTLHGAYSVWDLGDRPDKLLADIQTAREKKQKPALPPQPLVARTNGPQMPARGGPTAPSAGPAATAQANPPDAGSPLQEIKARQLLAAARVALQNGDTTRARLFADQVRDMHVVLNRPNDDSPEAIYRELAQRAGGSNPPTPPSNVRTVSATFPAPPPQAPAPPAGSEDSRTRALALMAEARRLLHDNRLAEARQKAMEAQQLGVVFQANEEGPQTIYQQAAVRAHQEVDRLVAQAGETVRFGGDDPQARLRRAEQELLQARQLAATFGLDVQTVDRSLAWVRQQRGGSAPHGFLPPAGVEGTALAANSTQGPPAGAPGVAPPGGGPAAPGGQGAELLNQARLELRKGNTPTARRLAETACDPRYGVRDEALAVLRNIDVEEFNQKCLAANRTFDAARAAYVRRDYQHALNLIAAINPRLLDEARQVKLREIMSTPEMQPGANSQLVQAGGPPAATGVRGSGTPGAAASTLGPDAGRASARDDPDRALMAKTLGMAQVRFGMARKEGMELQSEATQKFRSGQADAAIEMLNDYLLRLQDYQLDPGQLTLLRRPIESRKQQFQLLRAQEEFASRKNTAARAKDERGKLELAEQTKQKHVSELMKQYNDLYKEGKYLEAESMAMRAHELDPDNTVVTAAITIARRHRDNERYNQLKNNRERIVLDGLNEAENEGDPYAITHDIAINKEAAEISRARIGKYGSYTAPRKNEKERDIEQKLNTPVILNFTDVPLKAVIEDLRAWKGVNIWVDEGALGEHGVSLDRPVSVKLDQVSLKSALKLLLAPMHLTYVIADEVLQITTEDRARGKLVPTTYQVADLVIPVENYGVIGGPLPAFLGTPVNPPTQYYPSPAPGVMSLVGGAPVGSPTGSSQSSSSANSPFATAGTNNGGVQVTKRSSNTNEEMLIRLIMNTIQPRSWSEMGGPGTIDYFPLTMALVINQTPDIQDQIQDLLQALRRLQDQEVAVEVRFISLSDDFFERIGVNFNMNIVNNRNRPSIQPQLVTGNFSPDDYINVFQPKNFLSGLQGNNTLTPDLNIPITNDSFGAALPPFGGFNTAGLTMGIAYLSDIQVFLFMEAAQGDVRTNVMQAPKLSLFNGQTASLVVADHQLFTTGVNVVPQMGTFTFQPLVQQFNTGANLTLQAVITADRRFVRLSMSVGLQNLHTPTVQLFPVAVPIFPLLDGLGTGQAGPPVVFTQFVQQPVFDTVTVMTTVAVPDGGTVLMGGIKRLAEGRTEYGPPVLSKIPYINRLFKNIGYGRDTESLLIMVTPRIIIQAEEEERQTGVVIPPTVIP